MSLYDRLGAAYGAFLGAPVKDAVRLKAPPPAPVGPTSPSTRAKVTQQTGPRRRKRVAPLPIDRTRWLRADIEAAEHQANSGQLQRAAQIAQWVKEDLFVGGLMSTRCSVPRLPREWRGDEEARRWLQGEGTIPGCFDRIFPPGELEEQAIDHLDLGVAVSMFVHPDGARYPVLVDLDNQYLRYLPGEDRWQYQGWGKVYDVCPGDGVWVLHSNGLVDPWRRGLWSSLGYDQVSEDGAGLARDGFVWKFGNPFVIAKAPTGAAEEQKVRFWTGVIDWVMGFAGVTPGYDVELIEAKGEGSKVFSDAEARVERRAMIAIAGQLVTTTGGVGFANAEIFQTIASHLVARTAQDLCTTLNEQAIPHVLRWAVEAGLLSPRDRELLLAYDTTPPQARKAEAEAITAVAASVKALVEAGFKPDRAEYTARFRLPVEAAPRPAPEVGAALGAATPSGAEAPTKDAAARMAESMTAHGMEACWHGNPNRCRICGVQRVAEAIPGADGGPPTWKFTWEPIPSDEPRLTAAGGVA